MRTLHEYVKLNIKTTRNENAIEIYSSLSDHQAIPWHKHIPALNFTTPLEVSIGYDMGWGVQCWIPRPRLNKAELSVNNISIYTVDKHIPCINNLHIHSQPPMHHCTGQARLIRNDFLAISTSNSVQIRIKTLSHRNILWCFLNYYIKSL